MDNKPPPFPDWKSLLQPRLLFLAVMAGIFGTLTMWTKMRVLVLPEFNIGLEVRELFVVFAAAFTGPVGGALAGAISSVYSPAQTPQLHFATFAAHTLAGFALGLFYQPSERERRWRFLFYWFQCIGIYYLVLITGFITLISLLDPEFVIAVGKEQNSLWGGVWRLAWSAVPEALTIALLTAILMAALPFRRRLPLWRERPVR